MVGSDSGDSRAAADIADPLIGQVLNGRFTVLEQIGTGGMGRVYKAVQAPLERLVALKILNPNYGAGKDPGFQKRFFLEASMTSKLRHPNTITIIDYGRTEEGIFYIAMEYVEGQTLAALLTAHGALSWVRALYIGQQICRSLREAHKHGIVHRDLKPANVMILNEETDHDQIKVLDFGLVKSFAPDKPKQPNETELTQSGVLLGSPQYMAPEQARGIADPRSDIYSLGVLLYQMLAGRPPFVGRESIDVIVKHIREPPPPLRAPRPELEFPDEVAALVMRCLEKDPDQRYQSMDEMLEAMRRVGINAGLSGVFADPRSAPHSSGSMSPVPPRRATGQVAIGVAVETAVATRATSASNAAPELEVDLSESGVTDRRWLRKQLLALGAFALAIGGGLGILFAATREPPTPKTTALPVVPTARSAAATAPAPVRAEPPPRDETPAPVMPAPVVFRIASEPNGAKVTFKGRALGSTPLQFELPRESNGSAEAQLTFALDGYQSTTVTAEGSGPEVVLTQRLERKAAPAPTPKKQTTKKNTGYKDDPYQ